MDTPRSAAPDSGPAHVFVARRPRLRALAAGLAASVTLLGVAALPATAAAATTTSGTTTSGLVWPADWGYGGGWSDSGGSDEGSAGDSTTGNSSPATAAESKGVVLIDTVLSYAEAQAAGTGMILTSSGQVLTNYHVVEGATKITVTVASTGKTYNASVIGHDQTHDVALLQLQNASGLDTVKIDDHSVSVGDDVTAVGNAGGTGSLTAADGEVTSLDASITTQAEGTVASENLTNMIENDADVVAGDSGGPLYDSENEVVGIDTAGSSGSEIESFAIPIDNALKIVDEIRAGDATSTVRIGPNAFLGVVVSDNSEATYGGQGNDNGYFGTYGGDPLQTGDTTAEGATVSEVVDGGPAAKAGITAGDTITQVGSQAITSADDVSGILANQKVGDTITIQWVDSDGASHSANVTLAASPVA